MTTGMQTTVEMTPQGFLRSDSLSNYLFLSVPIAFFLYFPLRWSIPLFSAVALFVLLSALLVAWSDWRHCAPMVVSLESMRKQTGIRDSSVLVSVPGLIHQDNLVFHMGGGRIDAVPLTALGDGMRKRFSILPVVGTSPHAIIKAVEA